MSLEVIDLNEIIDVIRDPADWCRFHSAEDESGQSILPTDPQACRWCVLGAADLLGSWLHTPDLRDQLNTLWCEYIKEDPALYSRLSPSGVGYPAIGRVNDMLGHSELIDELHKFRDWFAERYR